MVQKRNKPIIVHSLYASYHSHPIELLRYYDIPVHDSLDITCKCMASLCQYGNYLTSYHAKTNFIFNWRAKAKKRGSKIIARAKEEGRRVLLEYEAKNLIKLHGVPVASDRVAETENQAVEIAEKIDGNVVLKIVSPDILHKSDAKGVKVNLDSEEQVRLAYQDILKNAKNYNPRADIRGILVSPMAAAGLEVIVGTKVDDQFGPVIMYGLGGIMVEIMKDVTFWVLPISPTSAKKMIKDTRSSIILDGTRGQAGYDKKSLKRLLLICSELMESYPEIEEMDLNPVILHQDGLDVVDARIILKQLVVNDD